VRIVSAADQAAETQIAIKPLLPGEQILFSLCCLAILLPTAAQSIITGLLLIWFVLKRAWRPSTRESRGIQTRISACRRRYPVLFVLACGILVASVFQLSLLAYHVIITPIPPEVNPGEAIEEHMRLIGKQGIYGLFVCSFFLAARRRGWPPMWHVKFMLGGTALIFVYAVFQRYTGIDWVHGFGASLPDERYAYGVYRASAFMGHPLTFAYNSMVFSLFSFGQGMHELTIRREKWQWFGCSALAFGCVLLSGSRWPLFVNGLLILGVLLATMRRSRVMWVVLGLVILASGIFGKGVWGRFTEPFRSDRPWEERVPRLVFWQVHWDMFQDHPLAGVGYAERRVRRLDYYNKTGYHDIERKYSAHNIYLQTLADSGLIGFVALFSLLGGLILASYRAWQRDAERGLLLVAGGTLLAGLMQNNLRDSEYLFALWLCFAWYFASRKDVALGTGN
jgi:O-antigen ligase